MGNREREAETKILIVGAGPTGLVAALTLRQNGLAPRIIDKREAGSGLSRAVGILPRSVQIFDGLGVGDVIRAQAVKLRGANFFINTKKTLSLPFVQRPGGETILCLPQDQTEMILRSALESAGGTVEFDHELTALEMGCGRAQALINGHNEEFDLVIGADGVRSLVRQAAGISYPGIDLPESWSIADVNLAPGSWQYPDQFCGFLSEGGRIVVIVPMGHDRYRLVSNTPDARAALPMPIDIAKINREAQFQISIRQAEHYAKGRVVIMGDAAHCHSPVGGRGMNLGIEDAWRFADFVTRGGYDEYSRERHTEGARIIRLSETGRKIATSPHQMRTRLLFGAVNCMPSALKAKLARRILER